MQKKVENRRSFIRNVGKTLFSFTVVGFIAGSPLHIVAQTDVTCGDGNPDDACKKSPVGGGWVRSVDANCGVSKDPDESCESTPLGTVTDPDKNCGQPSKGGVPTSGPKGNDTDEHCGEYLASGDVDPDDNCSISLMPKPASDPDGSCELIEGAKDNSCGDCDDHHDTDDNCGETLSNGKIDEDELCGHQHAVGGTEDEVCMQKLGKDSGCGVHKAAYSIFAFNDPDQSCGTQFSTVDMNCSAKSKATDETCTETPIAMPATTSPDEKCSLTDHDGQCSRYDQDESCSKTSKDESCGIVKLTGGIAHDPDEFCGSGNGEKDESCGTFYKTQADLLGLFPTRDPDENCGNGGASDNSKNEPVGGACPLGTG